jgi:hypothetical protein
VRSEERLAIRHLERVKLGTPYPQIVRRVREVTRSGALQGRCTLVADGTGVGAAVMDLLRDADLGCEVLAVTITGGEEPGRSRWAYHVPKKDLVARLRVLLETGELRIAKGLREAGRLTEEMMAMRGKVTGAGRRTYGAGGEAHDDLVLAVALACWGARLGEVGEMNKRLNY